MGLGRCTRALAVGALPFSNRGRRQEGERRDTENIIKMCSTPKFWTASSKVKQITLEKYFNVEKIFGAYTPETLPSRYLRTYLPIEKAWDKKWR